IRIEAGQECGSVVAGIGEISIPGDRGDDPGGEHYFANPVVDVIGDEEVTLAVEFDGLRRVKLRLYGRPVVAAETGNSGARDGGNHSVSSDAADAIIGRIRKIYDAGSVLSDAERIAERH